MTTLDWSTNVNPPDIENFRKIYNNDDVNCSSKIDSKPNVIQFNNTTHGVTSTTRIGTTLQNYKIIPLPDIRTGINSFYYNLDTYMNNQLDMSNSTLMFSETSITTVNNIDMPSNCSGNTNVKVKVPLEQYNIKDGKINYIPPQYCKILFNDDISNYLNVLDSENIIKVLTQFIISENYMYLHPGIDRDEFKVDDPTHSMMWNISRDKLAKENYIDFINTYLVRLDCLIDYIIKTDITEPSKEFHTLLLDLLCVETTSNVYIPHDMSMATLLLPTLARWVIKKGNYGLALSDYMGYVPNSTYMFNISDNTKNWSETIKWNYTGSTDPISALNVSITHDFNENIVKNAHGPFPFFGNNNSSTNFTDMFKNNIITQYSNTGIKTYNELIPSYSDFANDNSKTKWSHTKESAFDNYLIRTYDLNQSGTKHMCNTRKILTKFKKLDDDEQKFSLNELMNSRTVNKGECNKYDRDNYGKDYYDPPYRKHGCGWWYISLPNDNAKPDDLTSNNFTVYTWKNLNDIKSVILKRIVPSGKMEDLADYIYKKEKTTHDTYPIYNVGIHVTSPTFHTDYNYVNQDRRIYKLNRTTKCEQRWKPFKHSTCCRTWYRLDSINNSNKEFQNWRDDTVNKMVQKNKEITIKFYIYYNYYEGEVTPNTVYYGTFGNMFVQGEDFTDVTHLNNESSKATKSNNAACLWQTQYDLYAVMPDTITSWQMLIYNEFSEQIILSSLRDFLSNNYQCICAAKTSDLMFNILQTVKQNNKNQYIGKSYFDIPILPPLLQTPNTLMFDKEYWGTGFKINNDYNIPIYEKTDKDIISNEFGQTVYNISKIINESENRELINKYSEYTIDSTHPSIINNIEPIYGKANSIDHNFDKITEALISNISYTMDGKNDELYERFVLITLPSATEGVLDMIYNNINIKDLITIGKLSEVLKIAKDYHGPMLLFSFDESKRGVTIQSDLSIYTAGWTTLASNISIPVLRFYTDGNVQFDTMSGTHTCTIYGSKAFNTFSNYIMEYSKLENTYKNITVTHYVNKYLEFPNQLWVKDVILPK